MKSKRYISKKRTLKKKGGGSAWYPSSPTLSLSSPKYVSKSPSKVYGTTQPPPLRPNPNTQNSHRTPPPPPPLSVQRRNAQNKIKTPP